jgi:heme oxygenase
MLRCGRSSPKSCHCRHPNISEWPRRFGPFAKLSEHSRALAYRPLEQMDDCLSCAILGLALGESTNHNDPSLCQQGPVSGIGLPSPRALHLAFAGHYRGLTVDPEIPKGPGQHRSRRELRAQHRRAAPARASARATLRAATDDVHERMHAHPGYRALASGGIQTDDYRRLLARSYGFYLPIEVQLTRGRDRSRRLETDLMALGMTPGSIEALPFCIALPPLDSLPKVLGAAYVVEGAALGGLVLARALISNSSGVAPPAAFLLGDGENGGRGWHHFIAQLEEELSGTVELETATQSARVTFETFEAWMAAWDC